MKIYLKIKSKPRSNLLDVSLTNNQSSKRRFQACQNNKAIQKTSRKKNYAWSRCWLATNTTIRWSFQLQDPPNFYMLWSKLQVPYLSVTYITIRNRKNGKRNVLLVVVLYSNACSKPKMFFSSLLHYSWLALLCFWLGMKKVILEGEENERRGVL